MKENIETKDVQRTEYLDKNGLDMLWAKVKENTHNQVEVERNRATTQEDRIIETKADKSELHSSYVSNSTFTALQEKVAANTDAISDKQDAGNYLSYETLNNEGYYEIPDICISGSGGSTKTDIDSQSISVNCDYPASHTTITCDGISNTDNNANHVYATDGSIADLTQYIKIDDAYLGCIPYYKKYIESEIQRYQLTDKEGIELSSYGVITKLLGDDITISSGYEDLTLTRSGISINSYGGAPNHFYVNVNSEPELNLWSNQCAIVAKIYSNTQRAMIGIRKTHNYDNYTYDLELSADGIGMRSKTTKDIVTANNSTAHIGLDDDQTEYTYVTPLENGKVPAEYLDLSQYAKKSEIPEVDASNLVSKTATDAQIIKSELTVKDNLRVAHDNTNEWFTNINYDGISVVGNDGKDVYINQNDCIKVSAQIDPNWIYSKMDLNEMYLHGSTNSLRIGLDSIKARRYRTHSSNQSDTLFILSEQGVSLYNGDNNHVLTSGGSTIDITQYVLKSVYDEKIAALEARIAALEAKHTETA